MTDVLSMRKRNDAAPATAVGVDASRDRIRGLDSLRFLCALVVAIGHVGLVANPPRVDAARLAKVAYGVYNMMLVGQAAVIVFFLVSGFCIHFPYRRGRIPALGSFYARRFFRIVPPAVICFLVLRRAVDFDLTQSILWSVICETIYYLLYPVLLVLRRRFSWMGLIVAAAVAAAVLIAVHVDRLTHGASYMVFGWWTWVLGLPCWLLGCWLAENGSLFAVPSVGWMWTMRVGIFGLAAVLRMLRFYVHSVATSNCILIDLFAMPACVWLGYEIAYARDHAPAKGLEWAGGWSYSLYIVHPMIVPGFVLVGLGGVAAGTWTHGLLLGVALVASYGFFLAVERPSHRLAVWMGRLVERRGWVVRAGRGGGVSDPTLRR